MLSGLKTKTFSVLLAVSAGLFGLGWIDIVTFEALVGIFGAGIVFGLRDAMK